MINEFKLTVVHLARPNPMQICGCAWIYRWTKKPWKITTGPPDRRAVAGRGPRAAGPTQAVGRGPAFSKTLMTYLIGQVIFRINYEQNCDKRFLFTKQSILFMCS